MKRGGTNVVTQLDKDDVEAVGLVKFDFPWPEDADDHRLGSEDRQRVRTRIGFLDTNYSRERPEDIQAAAQHAHGCRVPA